MELSKLSKSPSLLRSPTIKSGIDSLSSLGEVERSHEPSKSRLGYCWPPTSGSRDGRSGLVLGGDGFHGQLRERLQLLVPPFIIVAVPFVWWCVKDADDGLLTWLSLDIVPWYWFNVSALLVLFVAIVVSIHLAVPHLFGRALVSPTWTVIKESWQFVNTTLVATLQLINEKKEVGWKARSPSSSSSQAQSPGFSTKPKKSHGYGEGVQSFSNGDVYEGEFYEGKISGSGVYYFYKSGRYEGDWVDGKYDGNGVETWARGSRYRGQYRQGMREGYGIYRFYTGDVYSGHWSNGQSHGLGMQTCGDGSCYVGEFKWGVKHGVGYYHFRNGDTYAGEYFADKMHGYGVYKFANGHRYEGSWHDGRKQGLGIYTFRNGDTHAGHWHLGTLESRSTQAPSASSSFSVAVNHSKVLNAVQEARKAAQRGMDVERVDDRVKKAVALANQAANAARVAAVKAVHR